MYKQHHPSHVLAYGTLFLLLLLTIATGPIGFVVLVMVGIPIAILVGFGSMAHSRTKVR